MGCPLVPTHKESIELIQSHGSYYTPELKTPNVAMPYEGTYTQEDFATQMIQEYIDMGIPPEHVWPQSFLVDDVIFWIETFPEFGEQAVALDGDDASNSTQVIAFLDLLVENNVNIVAPPMWRLVDPDPDSDVLMKASEYAMEAKARGIDIITWTLERTAPGLIGYYYQSLNGEVELTDGDKFALLYVLSEEVGVLGIFSDWPATVTFYANCMGVGLRSAANAPADTPTAAAPSSPDASPTPATSSTRSRSVLLSAAFVVFGQFFLILL
jgi:glycerophosphoryl diester phosphodiesterase